MLDKCPEESKQISRITHLFLILWAVVTNARLNLRHFTSIRLIQSPTLHLISFYKNYLNPTRNPL